MRELVEDRNELIKYKNMELDRISQKADKYDRVVDALGEERVQEMVDREMKQEKGIRYSLR